MLSIIAYIMYMDIHCDVSEYVLFDGFIDVLTEILTFEVIVGELLLIKAMAMICARMDIIYI